MRGFTLIELLTALGVAAILLAVGIPAMRAFLQSDQLLTESNSLAMSLRQARSEAIKSDLAGGVTVCPSVDGLTCTGASNWAQGWIVLSSAAGAQPVVVTPALAPNNTLTEANNSTGVTFLSNGLATAAAAFTLCDSRGASFARYTQVTATGRVLTAPKVGVDLTNTALVCP
jgi:type IV fimbrial biogenesis protein FimT